MQPIQVLVLGPEGAGRAALEHTLARLGCSVSAAEAHADQPAPGGADVLMLDLRGDESWAELVPGLNDEPRPVVIVAERPRPFVRELVSRAAGTVLLTGTESDAGYRVALSVLCGLRRNALASAAVGSGDDVLTRLAAL